MRVSVYEEHVPVAQLYAVPRVSQLCHCTMFWCLDFVCLVFVYVEEDNVMVVLTTWEWAGFGDICSRCIFIAEIQHSVLSSGLVSHIVPHLSACWWRHISWSLSADTQASSLVQVDCSVIEVCPVVCCQIVISSGDICQYHGHLNSRGQFLLSLIVHCPLVVDSHAETVPNWFLCCHSVPVKTYDINLMCVSLSSNSQDSIKQKRLICLQYRLCGGGWVFRVWPFYCLEFPSDLLLVNVPAADGGGYQQGRELIVAH